MATIEQVVTQLQEEMMKLQAPFVDQTGLAEAVRAISSNSETRAESHRREWCRQAEEVHGQR